MNKKRITILGSTGSIGTQAIDVIKRLGLGLQAVTANTDVKTVEEQVRCFKIPLAAMSDENAARDLKIRLADTSTVVLSGPQGVCEAASQSNADVVLNSIVGMAGLLPTIEAIKSGKDIALANKETLVAAGQIVKEYAAKYKVKIMPVDSEHSAIFQCLQEQGAADHLKSIILTASGGPFFGKKTHDLKDVTLTDALAHPNWSMGAKITVDSATLMNKGLELIEAMHLFNVTPEMIKIVIQRESIIHSMVQFKDNAVIAQLSMPDMSLPIQYAITYPDRVEGSIEPIDFIKLGKITFYEPDYDTFRCLPLAINAAKQGGTITAVLNGANEAAVDLFINGKIAFTDIAGLVEKAIADHKCIENPTLEDILGADREARMYTYCNNSLNRR